MHRQNEIDPETLSALLGQIGLAQAEDITLSARTNDGTSGHDLFDVYIDADGRRVQSAHPIWTAKQVPI